MILLDIYSVGLWITYVLIAIALLGMFVGIIISIMQNLKEGGIVAIGGFIGLIVLFAIGYVMSSDVVPAGMEKFIDSSGYKLSSGGLITFYILLVIAAVMTVFGIVKGIVTGN